MPTVEETFGAPERCSSQGYVPPQLVVLWTMGHFDLHIKPDAIPDEMWNMPCPPFPPPRFRGGGDGVHIVGHCHLLPACHADQHNPGAAVTPRHWL